MPVKCVCKQCNKEFYVKPYFLRIGKGVYCSKKCKDEAKPHSKYTFEQFKVLYDIFDKTGNVKLAAEKSGINAGYAKNLCVQETIDVTVNDNLQINFFKTNVISKYSTISGVDYTNQLTEFAKNMPADLSESQAVIYAAGYCAAKGWTNGLRYQLFNMIHRAYKLKQKRAEIVK